MKIIFTTIFLFSASFFLSASQTANDYGWRTASGIVAEYRRGSARNSGLIREIRELDRELSRLFMAPAIRGRECRIVIGGNSKKLTVSRDRKNNYIVAAGEDFPAAADPESRRELAGALLAMRFGIEQKAPLPVWLAAGLEHVRISNRTSGRIVKNTRNYPLLRAMLGCDTSPGWRYIVSASTADKQGIDMKVYQELSRVAMEIFASIYRPGNNALGDYAIGMLEKKLPADELFKNTIERRVCRISGMKSFDDFMSREEILAAFNSRTPCPAEYALRQLDRILSIPGKPAAWFTVLPERMQQNDPEALVMRDRIAGEIKIFNRGIPPEIQVPAIELAELIAGIDGDTSPVDLQNSYLKLRDVLRQRQKMEKLLAETEQRSVSPFLLYSDELKVVDGQDTALSAAGIRFLNEVEKKYLND